MDLRARRLGENVDRAVKQIALAVHREVVQGTPVDTGKARSNWIVSINTPVTSEIKPYVPYPKFSKANGQQRSESGNFNAAVAQGEVVVASRRSGQTVYIQNNVKYIGRLNDGSSAQAPQMFVQRAVELAIRFLAGLRNLTR